MISLNFQEFQYLKVRHYYNICIDREIEGSEYKPIVKLGTEIMWIYIRP